MTEFLRFMPRFRSVGRWPQGWLLVAFLLQPAVVLGGLPSTPVLQWTWDGRARDNEYPYAYETCLVVQFTDDDGDGDADADDVPDVLVPHARNADRTIRIDVLDGETGELQWRFTDPRLRAQALSVGDVDADGWPDVVGGTGSSIVALNRRGGEIFERPLPEPDSYLSAMGLADIDNDGDVDITVGRSVLLGGAADSWVGTGGRGEYAGGGMGQRSVAIDLDPTSPGLELLAGNTLHAASGQLLWQAVGVPDGVPSVADFDGDGTPEVLLLTMPDLYMLDASGGILGREADVFVPRDFPAPPVVADLDGDALPDFVVATVSDISAWKWIAGDFLRLWSQPVHVIASIPGATAFDFDCDGASEIVYRDEDNWYVFSGPDGAVLHQEPFPSGTDRETPIVVNADRDPWAEIIVPSQWWEARVYEVPGSATPRSIFNQRTYHATNIRDDGTVPRMEPPSWLENNTWLAQVAADPVSPCGSGCEPTAAGASDAVDDSPCLRGLRVQWQPVTFPSGRGHYNVYRSDDLQGLSCPDALSRAPIAVGLDGIEWVDSDVEAGRRYVHAVQAEDARRADPTCTPVGPWLGTVGWSCTSPVLAEGSSEPPAGIGSALRVRHDGDLVLLEWTLAPPLPSEEHYHVLRSEDPAGVFGRVSVDPHVARGYSYLDDRTRALFCFHVRTANDCEDESLE